MPKQSSFIIIAKDVGGDKKWATWKTNKRIANNEPCTTHTNEEWINSKRKFPFKINWGLITTTQKHGK